MSIGKDISFTEKKFKLLDKTITVRFSDENQAEKLFDFSELNSEWHRKIIGRYHLTELIRCLRDYYYYFKFDRDLTLELKGIFLFGKVVHKLVQENLEKKSGFVIVEKPMVDELELENGDVIWIVAKSDVIETTFGHSLNDIKTTRYLPMLLDITDKKFEEKFGLYILQVLAMIYFENNTYFKTEPLTVMRLFMIDKYNCYTKFIEVDYDNELGEYFYLKIRERAKYLHGCIINDIIPTNGLVVSENCKGCSFLELCPEGKEIVASLKAPVNYESTAYQKKFEKENKHAYWKYDELAKKWIKTKGFVEFLKNDLKYTEKQISEMV